MFKKINALLLSVFVTLGFASPAFAAVDLTALTGAISPTDVTVGVLAIAAVLAVIYATMMASKKVLGMIRGG